MLFLSGISQSPLNAPLVALDVDERKLIRLVSGGGVGEGLEFLVIGMGVEFVGLFAGCVSDKIGQEEELLEEGDDPL